MLSRCDFIAIFLMTNGVVHFSMGLSAVCVSFSVRCLFRSFAHSFKAEIACLFIEL